MSGIFPWLPIGTPVNDETLIGRVLFCGHGYQVVEAQCRTKTILIIDKTAGWLSSNNDTVDQLEHLVTSKYLCEFSFGNSNYLIGIFPNNQTPIKISTLIKTSFSSSFHDLKELACAIREMRENFPNAIWHEALFLVGQKECLVTKLGDESEKNRKEISVKLLVGEIGTAEFSVEAIKKLNQNLTISEIRELLSIIGFEDFNLPNAFLKTSTPSPDGFSLPGRPDLESFFREYIIDYFHRYPEYSRMGIKPPNGILLHGLPGTGKSYAVQQLAKYLQWQMYDVDIGSVASPYIHQTSKLIKELFEKAAETAPSIVLLEEIDALAAARSSGTHDHKVEEITQLLRLIEKASATGILVIATTNRYALLDDAIIRKGRFDHVIEVGLPSQTEILSALNGLLLYRPVCPKTDLKKIAILLDGRPMSDVAWVVNEAARIAVKSQKKLMDVECFELATSRVSK